MTDPGVTRVAVYIDFDNIVISRYDQVHGRGKWQQDRAREAADDEVVAKLSRATVDVGAIIDYASSYGTLVLTRAYADWSVPVNADYRRQLVNRAVDLVQLFPAAAYAKNGADIRLAVDAVEDMFRLPDLTHVVIVAGDSDYVPLAQRCKRLGRYVVGLGVAGSTARSLAAACDEFASYDALPGISEAESRSPAPAGEPASGGTAKRAAPAGAPAAGLAGGPAGGPAFTGPMFTEPAFAEPSGDAGPTDDGPGDEPASRAKGGRKSAKKAAPKAVDPDDPQQEATRLLERALRLGHEKNDEDWLFSGAVKTQMRRMDPSFSEKALGFRSFSDFVKSRESIAELDETDQTRRIRLTPQRP